MTTAPTETSKAQLTLAGGLSIGYDVELAKVEAPIELGQGTHYLLGRNGRGKTTLFRTLCGMLKPFDGKYAVEGETRFISEDLLFDAELKTPTILKAMLPKEAAKSALEFAKSIELDLEKPLGKLSTGNKRKVNLLVAEFGFQGNERDIIFLDEPFTGLDAPTRQAFIDRWANDTSNVIRVVSAHPDFDEMPVPSALVISNGTISHENNPTMKWGQLRTYLN